jgi:hypothetical protein
VEGDAVKVAFTGQEDKAVDRDRGFVGIKINDKLAALFHFDRRGVLLAGIDQHGRRTGIFVVADQHRHFIRIAFGLLDGRSCWSDTVVPLPQPQ